MMKSFRSTIENKVSDKVWGNHFIVPSEVVQYFLGEKQKRFICKLNDLLEYNCAFMPRGEGEYFVLVNREISKKLNLEIGSEVSVQLREDKSEYGMPVPQEMIDLFGEDDEFYQLFNGLTPGKQRNLLYLVGKPKSKEARVKKAVVICNHLVNRNGDLDFKILNQDFKDYNELLKG